jgi:hypothetical protein
MHLCGQHDLHSFPAAPGGLLVPARSLSNVNTRLTCQVRPLCNASAIFCTSRRGERRAVPRVHPTAVKPRLGAAHDQRGRPPGGPVQSPGLFPEPHPKRPTRVETCESDAGVSRSSPHGMRSNKVAWGARASTTWANAWLDPARQNRSSTRSSTLSRGRPGGFPSFFLRPAWTATLGRPPIRTVDYLHREVDGSRCRLRVCCRVANRHVPARGPSPPPAAVALQPPGPRPSNCGGTLPR